MPVQLIVDYFGLDTEAARIAGKTDPEIQALRCEVREHLQQGKPELLRIRLTHRALWKQFSDFEGMNGVLPTRHLVPREELTAHWKTPLPDWLTDDWIMQLGLLQKPAPVKTRETSSYQPFVVQLLTACRPDWIAALRQQPPAFLQLLNTEQSIQGQLATHLAGTVGIDHALASRFIEKLASAPTLAGFLQEFAYQQHLQRLRHALTQYALSFTLPAQTVPSDLTIALPLLPLAEDSAQQLPQLWLDAIQAVAHKIGRKELPADRLADCVLADWPSIWSLLADLCTQSPGLITPALVQQGQRFHSVEAQAFTQQLAAYLANSHYQPLSPTATVDEALSWSEGYFAYLRASLHSTQALDETINSSFTDWLLAQTSRISRSESTWRFCAQQINHYLARGYLVIVTVIDALSALNQDMVLDTLQTLDQLTLSRHILFAPLPTLTEIGKLAVLTGKPSHSLPNIAEAALRQTYQAHLPSEKSLSIFKSWQDIQQPITAETQLVVFFENRLDERLHAAPNFDKHRQDIKPVVNQLKQSIKSWLKDAAQREVVFLITADHGMTITHGQYTGAALGEANDRAFKLNSEVTTLPANFVRVNQDSKSVYAVPKTRLGLSPAALAHGGLTPEEVLIPLIILERENAKFSTLPIEVVAGPCVRLGNQFWQLELRLEAGVAVERVRFNLKPPFKLDYRAEPIDQIRAHKSHLVVLKFRADCEQMGLTELNVVLEYDRAGTPVSHIRPLSIHFPAPLIERDAGAQSFEGMF